MDIEQYFGDAMAYNQSSGENKSSQQEKWKSGSDRIGGPDDNSTGGFDCNICLDSVQDPVVTLCGHLYCWPCIYKWLHLQSISTESQDQEHQECPVCKAEVSRATLIPLYGRGQTEKSSKDKAPHLGMVIPRRPLAPGFGPNMPRTSSTTISLHSTQQLHHNYAHQSQPYYPQHGSSPVSSMHSSGGTRNMFDPMIGMFGEMVYARVFGNSITNLYTYPNSYHLAGSSSPRVRRHIMQADRSLSRICFFLFCCIMLCLLLF